MVSRSSSVFSGHCASRTPLVERMATYWRKQKLHIKIGFYFFVLSLLIPILLYGMASRILSQEGSGVRLWEAAALLTVLIALFSAWYFSRRLLRTINTLNTAADQFSLGDYGVQIDIGPKVRCWEIMDCARRDCPAYDNPQEKCWFVDNTLCTETVQKRFPDKLEDCLKCRVHKSYSGDDLTNLADSFNNAIHRLRHFFNERQQIHKQMLQRERLSTIGETVAGIAHSIKNILGMIKGGEYLVESGLSQNNPNRTREGWEMVKNGNRYISDLALKMLTICREREPQYEEIELAEIVDSVLPVMQTKAQSKNVHIDVNLDPSLSRVIVDTACMREALINLTDNAIDACGAGRGVVTIGSSQGTNGLFDLYVEDNGPGISPEIRSQVLSPFFSTKGEKGTGLGLAVVDKIISEHGGEISIQSGFQGGCRMVMRIPLLDRVPNHAMPPPTPKAIREKAAI